MRTIKGNLVVLLFYSLVVFVFVSTDFVQGNDIGIFGSIVHDSKDVIEVTNKKQTVHDDDNSREDGKREKGKDKDGDKGNDDKGDDDENSDDEDDKDSDGDGYSRKDDCDDNAADANPGATEIPYNSKDDDLDGDGYGNPHITTNACRQPSGYVANNTNCNDTNAAVNPGATEIKKNGIDDDSNASTPDNDTGVNLPPDPGKAGKETLLGIDTDGDGVRDDIQRYIYFTYPDDKKLRLGLTYYAIEFQGVLKDANDREAAYDHANKMARHGECLFYLKDEDSFDIIDLLRTKILNTRERSMAYITYSDNLCSRFIRGAPLKEWKDICSFDVDETGGD